MQQVTSMSTLNVDLTRIENAEVRRALRQLIMQLQETITQQQVEIEALLEMMLDKHLSSVSEFKRHVQLIRQRTSERADRLHSQVAQAMREETQNLQVTPRETKAPESEDRQVYRL